MSSRIVGSLRVNLGLDATSFVAGIEKTQASLRDVGARIGQIGLAVSAAGAGIGLAIRGSVNRADELTKLAQKIGLPVEELSQLEHVAKLSGLSLQQLETGVAQLSRRMVEGNDAFGDIGIALRDAEGVMRPTSAVMADLADVLASMPDASEKTTLAMKLMGEAGVKMIPMLNAGAESITAGMAEADAMGLTVTQDVGRAAEAMNDNVARLQAALGGLATQIATELVPVVNALLEPIVELARRFGTLSPEMREFAAIIAGSFLVGGPVLVALGAMTIAIGALSWPVLVGAAALAVMTAGLVAFWPEIQSAAQAVERFATDAVEAVTGFIDDTAAAIAGIPDYFRRLGSDIIDGLRQGINSAWQGLKDDVNSMIDWLPASWRSGLRMQSPSRVFREIGEFVMLGLAQGMDRGVAAARAALGRGTTSLIGALGEMGITAGDLNRDFSRMFASIVTGSARARTAIHDLSRSLLGTITTNAFSTILGSIGLTANAAGNAFAGGRILPFANGGVVGGPVLFGMQGGLGLMGEAGPEAILPLSRGADGRLGVTAQASRIELVLAMPEGVTLQEVRQIAGQEAVAVSARVYARARRERV